jgi:hypothetical protein
LDFSKLFSVGFLGGVHPDSCISWVWRAVEVTWSKLPSVAG